MNQLIHRVFFDLCVAFFQSIINTFFRDIRVRGLFNVPSHGAVIFVIAPHHNQFLDGCVVIPTIRRFAKRPVSFLIATKSYNRPVIGTLAKLTESIPVERAQDLLKAGTGKIYLGEADNEIIGEGTKFTEECMVKGLIGLPNSRGNFQILEIVDDYKVIIKNSYKDKNNADLTDQRKQLLSDGTNFKVAPHVDNHTLFNSVYDFLNSNKVLGLFPEGGSHDRTDLLPLKPGVALMALGAVQKAKDPNQVINIVPLGLNYFHPHKFRSRAVLEFGKPIEVTKEMGQKYAENARDTVNELMDLITLKLKEVTVTCNDYDTLVTLQAARRLFTVGQREHIPLPMVIEMNRRLIKGYELNKEKPDVIELKELVKEYNLKLVRLGLHDHQVDELLTNNKLRTAQKFLSRLIKCMSYAALALPGTILFSPVFITSRVISQKKQKEALANSVVKVKARDVLGSWKVLVALIIAPILYIFYSIIGTIWICQKYDTNRNITFIGFYVLSVFTTYSSMRIGEIGMDYYKSLLPLFLAIYSSKSFEKNLQELKQQRAFLSDKVTDFCDKYGPTIFDDYQQFYAHYNELDEDSMEVFSDPDPELSKRILDRVREKQE